MLPVKKPHGSFLVLAANTPWVYSLCECLSHENTVTAVRFYDWRNTRKLKSKWPDSNSLVRRIFYNLPPGYAGKLERLLRPIITRRIAKEYERLKNVHSQTVVICPYPFLARWIRFIPNRNIIYYNLDDYICYDPNRRLEIERLESELVAKARLTLCLSTRQVHNIKSRYPESSHRVIHFPLGVTREFLNQNPYQPPIHNSVGYIGNLTNRVNWALVLEVIEQLPELQFYFVGSLEELQTGKETEGWRHIRSTVLTSRNVVYLGAVPQSEVCRHYWEYAVNWMPYDSEHPFNIASCPTKIMDALASGRPFISTSIPEVALYPSWIHRADIASEISAKIRSLNANWTIGKSIEQVSFAEKNCWEQRAEQLRCLIDESAET
jgi:teichuronic acid biosynthesis glycosyltransferase TuaH